MRTTSGGAHHLLRLLVPVSPFVTTQSIRSDPSVSGGIEQKQNIFLTAYVGFPVAPIFMIWSSDLGSGWIPWPHDSTALSTRIIPDDATRSHRPTLSHDANGPPSMPRRSSNRRQKR